MKMFIRQILSSFLILNLFYHQALFAATAETEKQRMDAVTAPIIAAVEKATLGGDNTAEYKQELQKDIVMVIIGQVTSRLSACSSAPDMEMAISAGEHFINGEIAEYIKTQALQKKMKEIIAQTNKADEQIQYLVTLRKEYATVLESTEKKQVHRQLSKDGFINAATLAASEETEDQSLAQACQSQNNAKVAGGSGQADNQIMIFVALAAMYYSYPYCAGCAAAAAVLALKLLAEGDEKSCQAGGSQTNNNISERTVACNKLGTEDMFNTSQNPSTTASKTIYDTCISSSQKVSGSAGQGCQGYSSNGAGPYSSCDLALDAFKRNMVWCPVSVFNPASNVDPVKATGVTAGEVSGVSIDFILSSTKNLSRGLDLRMASPYQRTIVWKAFANLTDVAIATNKISIEKIKSNIEKLDKLIAEMMRLKNGHIINKPKEMGINAVNAIPSNNKLLEFEKSKFTPAKELLKTNLEKNTSFQNISSNVQDLSMKLAVELDNKSSKIEDANSQITNAERDSRSKAILDAFKLKSKQLEKVLKAQGINVNINDEASKLSKSILTSISKDAALNSKGSSLSSAISSYENIAGKDSNAQSDLSLPKFNIPSSNAEFGNGFSGSQFGKSGSNLNSDAKKPSGEAASKDADENNNLIQSAIEARDHKNNGGYDTAEDDSIFTKLTKAYIRNYDKVLNKKTNKLP